MISYILKKIQKVLYFILHQPEKIDGNVISGFSRGLQNVVLEGKNSIPDRCNFSGNIAIGKYTTLGYNNFFHGNITIGRYCQIGADVAIHTTNHPITFLSTYINKNLFEGDIATLKQTKEVVIGNDVWIGHGAIILGGLTIGNGAIIAAGSVVTKSVEPYAIVAGNPAKMIRKRFSDTIISEVEALQWWLKSPEELQAIRPLFFKDFNTANSIYE